MRLPEIRKTPKMELLELKDPQKRDVRLIVRDALLRGKTLKRAAELLWESHQVEVDYSTLHGWTTEWGWRSETVLITPGIPKARVA